MIQELAAGQKLAGDILFDAKTQGIGVSPGHDLAAQITPDIQKKVDDAMAAMVAGHAQDLHGQVWSAPSPVSTATA